MHEDAEVRLAIQSGGKFAKTFAPHRICDTGARVEGCLSRLLSFYVRKVRSGQMSARANRGWGVVSR
jgi:hypothetical protein